ncbi:carboxymuconolactone decarboxylase family protein [Dactylosporangium sp. CS-033363]|uniref:carboxymuconolactone decarboxylase family protein n=1 Tax=Dactylosporangium sp. CS-033363 TaxID=3239935 RepID=UPI003D94D20E
MPHIALNSNEPGIRGLFRYRPETALPLNGLVEALLCGPGTLTRGERELIAAFVSGRNECRYCYSAHAAYAAAQLPEGIALVERVHQDVDTAPVTPKMRSLLAIAAAVQQSGKSVTEDLVAAARAEDATDQEIHDTVLIAAAFCMFNRYVDGLATALPDDPAFYTDRAKRITAHGYLGVLQQEVISPATA